MNEDARLVSARAHSRKTPSEREIVRRTGRSASPTADVGPSLAFDAYCSIAWALHFVAAKCRFLAGGLARQIAADAAGGSPPLPPEPLAEDQELAALLANLPAGLQAADPASWAPLPVAERPCFLCHLAAHEEVPLGSIETLSRHLAGRLVEALTARYGLDLDHANYLAALARDEAVTRAIERAPTARIEAYLADVSQHGLLDGERLITYARRGNSPLFIVSIAQCVGMDSELVEAFLEENGSLALERILLRSDLVHALRVAICSAYEEAIAA